MVKKLLEKPTTILIILEKSDVKKLKQLALDKETSVSEMVRKLIIKELLSE